MTTSAPPEATEPLVAWRGRGVDLRTRLQLAFQLVDLVAKVHERGEAHGALSVEAFRVAPGSTPSAASASLQPPATPPTGAALEAARRDDTARVAAIATWLVRGGSLEGAPDAPEASVPASILRALDAARTQPGPSAPELRAALAAQAASLKAQLEPEASLRAPLFHGKTQDDVLGLGTEELPAALRDAARARAAEASSPSAADVEAILAKYAPPSAKAAFTKYEIQQIAAPTPTYDPDVAAYQRALSIDRFEQLAPLFGLLPGGRLIFWIVRALVRSRA